MGGGLREKSRAMSRGVITGVDIAHKNMIKKNHLEPTTWITKTQERAVITCPALQCWFSYCLLLMFFKKIKKQNIITVTVYRVKFEFLFLFDFFWVFFSCTLVQVLYPLIIHYLYLSFQFPSAFCHVLLHIFPLWRFVDFVSLFLYLP